MVYGMPIPQSALDAGILRMQKEGSFTLNSIHAEIHHVMGHDGDNDIAYRAADRLIQQQRKLGNIGPSDLTRTRSSYWRWIKK